MTVNAFAEASYGVNFGHPDSGLNGMRVFDSEDHKFQLDVAEVVVQRPAEKPAEFGFRFDATGGQTIPRAAAASGLFRDADTGEAHNADLQQVFVSWVAPLGKGLRIDAGKFVTPFGMELIDGYDGYNDNQTRSILFGYSIPFTHTGLRATYAFSDRVTGVVGVVQGWDNWRDNNAAKSVFVQMALSPSPRWTLSLGVMGGPEQTDNSHDNRFLYNAVATFKPHDRVTLGLDVVVGEEESLPAPGSSARWSGAAGYLRWDLTDTFALALRAEAFDDGDGVRTGTPQTVKEMTLTPTWKLGEHFVLRGDLRRDWSGAPVFQNRARAASGQTTATVGLLFVY